MPSTRTPRVRFAGGRSRHARSRNDTRRPTRRRKRADVRIALRGRRPLPPGRRETEKRRRLYQGMAEPRLCIRNMNTDKKDFYRSKTFYGCVSTIVLIIGDMAANGATLANMMALTTAGFALYGRIVPPAPLALTDPSDTDVEDANSDQLHT